MGTEAVVCAPRTKTSLSRNRPSDMGKPVAERPRPIVLWLAGRLQRQYAKVGLDVGHEMGEIGDGRSQLIWHHR